MNPIDLERNEKLRLISSNLPENTHPFAAKQMMLAQRKSVQQQANWQSVKPTMIQMSPQQRETRPNRQANLNLVDDPSSSSNAAGLSSSDLGIQMRTSMSQRRNNNDEQQQVQQEQLMLKPSTGQVIKQTNSLQNLNNQQQKEDDARFEQQQQNQMVDYSEESEPDLENNISSNATSGMEGDYQGRVGQQPTSGGSVSGSEMPAVNSVDSSSSSMMLEPQKEFERKKPPVSNESALNGRTRQQGNVTQVDLMRSKTQGDEKSANGPIESEKGGELSQSTIGSSTMSPSTTKMSTLLPGKQVGPTNDTTRRQPQATTQTRQQPSSKRPVLQSGTMTTTSAATQRPFSTSTTTATRLSDTRDGVSSGGTSTTTTTVAVTEPTSTASPSTSVNPRLVMSTAGDNVDLNETPISIIDNEQPRGQPRGQQQAAKSTTPTGRVELENGRPATGGSRQMATTTSARLPTKPSTAGASSTTPSRKSSSTTISTTPIPLSETQTVRSNDGVNVAQPGMRIMGTLSTTSKPTQEGAGPARATLAPAVNISTLSPNQQPTETTTMPAGSTSNETTDSSSGSESGEDGDDDDDDETSTSGNDSKQSGGISTMSNATNLSDSDDSNDDSSTSSDGESEQDQTTTVSTITTTTTAATKPTIQTTTAKDNLTTNLSRAQTSTESKIATTTQQPALTTIDIERLPIKDQSGPKSTITPGISMVMMRTSTSSPSSTLADISRITRPSSTTTSTRPSSTAATSSSSSSPSPTSTSLPMNQQSRQQQQQQQFIQMPNTNLIMMNLDQTKPSTIGGETAITMPIETLMKMMMMNQIMRENNELGGSTMPIATLEQTTQTPSITSSDINSPSTTEASGTSASQATQPTSVSVEQSEFSSTVALGKEGDEKEKNVSQNGDTEPSGMFKKKLQPPPTTRQPSSSKTQTAASGQSAVESSQTGSMQTTTISPPTAPTTTTTTMAATTTVSPTSLEADGPTQRTMFVNIVPSSGSMMDIASGDREEPKIDLINLDLLPIQRIMNSQSGMLNDKLKNNASTTQPSVEQQQQQMANEIMRGTSQTPAKPLDRLMLEVEPGMRLRPPMGMAEVVMRGTNMVGGIQTNNGQVMGSIKTGVNNPANTMYTLMTSSSVSPAQQQQGKAHSKKPASATPSEQRAAAIPQAPVKSAPNMRQSQQQQMIMNSRTMPNIAQQQSASSTVPSNPSSMSSSLQQQPQITRTTQPAVPFQTTFQTTTTPAPRNSMRFMSSSTSTTTSNQQLMQTSARPRFMDMNMIELEMEREGGRSTSKTKTEITDMMKLMMMRKAEQNEKQQQTSMRASEFNPDFGAVTTVTTTTTKSPTGLEMEQQTMFNTTTTSAQSSTLTESSTTLRPSLINNTTLSASSSSSTLPRQQANLSTVSNMMAQTTASAATTTTTSTPPTTTATSSQSIPTSGETENKPRTSTKETTSTLSPVQMSANSQQADNSRNNNNNNNNRLDRIQLQPTERRPQQVGTKTGKVSQQAQNKASNSNLTSSFISPKLRTDFNKFSSRVQQQPVRVNDKLVAQQPQKDAATESRQSSVVDSNARVVPTTTQSPIANGMIQNMAIRQFGGANRMSALANQPVPFGRPSAMAIQQQQQQNKQQQQRFELPSFEYGPSIAVRRPDEPLANGQIPNCTLTGKNFCVLTKDYPMNEVRQAVERSFRSVRIMYEELQTVSDQELHKDDFNSTNNKAASGKFACQTQVEMMRPGWAKDEITKEWMLVVNTDVFPQRVRTESCSQPNTPCEFISPFYDSTCQQRYSLHRMIAIDPHDSSRSPQVAVFKFPAGCVCRVNPIRRTST